MRRASNGAVVNDMKKRSKSARISLQVILGSQTIKAFVASPREFKVVGIVRMGMEFGLLAVTESGTYVRVNGSQVEALNQSAVLAAIEIACSSGRGESYAASREYRGALLPQVVVRKTRRPDPHLSPAVPAPRRANATGASSGNVPTLGLLMPMRMA